MTIETAAAAESQPSDSVTPRFRLLSALAAHGAMRIEKLSATSGVTGSSLSNAVYNAKKAGTLRRLNDGLYEITEAGRAYVMADHPGADAKFSKPRQAPSAPKTVSATAGGGGSQHTFIASLSSNGSFTLAKGGSSVALDAAEYGELQRYLRRVEGVAA